MSEQQSAEKPAERRVARSRLWMRIIAIAVLAVLAIRIGSNLTPAQLRQYEASLLEFGQESPGLLIVAAAAVYVVVTGLSLPGATVLTLGISWLFGQLLGPGGGFVTALLCISFASTAGASCAFLLSRFLFRELVEERFGQRLRTFNAALEREGPWYLLSLRLAPVVPFFVINLVMGLTPMRLRTFWWISQLGMLPGTAVYVYAGASLPSLRQLTSDFVSSVLSPQLWTALLLLALFPLAARLAARRLQRR